MKTSLVIDDRIFREAEKEARKEGKTLSETISHWARVGRDHLHKTKKGKRRLKAVDLGGPAKIDLTSRRDWIDLLS